MLAVRLKPACGRWRFRRAAETVSEERTRQNATLLGMKEPACVAGGIAGVVGKAVVRAASRC